MVLFWGRADCTGYVWGARFIGTWCWVSVSGVKDVFSRGVLHVGDGSGMGDCFVFGWRFAADLPTDSFSGLGCGAVRVLFCTVYIGVCG